jgi:hypothetical protein
MPSSTLRDTIIAAIFCTTCTMHSAVAQNKEPLARQAIESSNAEPQNSSWLDLFGCAKRGTMWKIGGTSFATYYNSNRMTEQRGREWAEGLFGGSTTAAKKAAPYIYLVGKSPRLKAASGLATISALGLWAYESITCSK